MTHGDDLSNQRGGYAPKGEKELGRERTGEEGRTEGMRKASWLER